MLAYHNFKHLEKLFVPISTVVSCPYDKLDVGFTFFTLAITDRLTHFSPFFKVNNSII